MSSQPPLRPETMIKITDSVHAAFALLAAMQLDLFTPLKDGPLSAEGLATVLGVGVTKLRPLLYVLVVNGLLTIDQNRFANTAETHHFLVRGQPEYIGGGQLLSDIWSAELCTAASIRTGMAQAKHDFSAMSRDDLTAFFRGLHSGALANGRTLMRRYDFSAYRSLLDVGGGSGGIAIALIEAYPCLQATVADLPTVTPITQEFVTAAGLADRIQVVGVDTVREPLSGSYDVAVMSSFIQVLESDEARRALRNVGRVMRPGGVLYILGRVLDDSRLTPPEAVNMNIVFINIYEGGQAYTEHEHRVWLAEAGFVNVERIVLASGSSIIISHKGI